MKRKSRRRGYEEEMKRKRRGLDPSSGFNYEDYRAREEENPEPSAWELITG